MWQIKFIYSEKATKFCEISTLLLTVCTVVKSKVEISQNVVAFSEYMNFNCSSTYLCKPRNQAYICHIWVNQLLVDMCKFHHLISFDGKIYLDGDIFLLIEFQQFFRCCRSVASSNSHCCTEIQILFYNSFISCTIFNTFF